MVAPVTAGATIRLRYPTSSGNGFPRVSGSSGATTSIGLSFATLDYLLNDYVTFVAGDMLLPLGTYSERTAGWLNKIPDDPLPRGVLPGGSGLLKPARGYCEFDGKRTERLRPDQLVRLGIGHVPEGRQLFPELTVRENLRLGAYTRGNDRSIEADMQRVFGYFPRLRDRVAQHAGTLSGGEQQMLAIARALMSRPRLLLLDEPSLGLAPLLVKEIFQIIGEIRAKGTTVVLVEQNAHMALQVADYAYLLETGRVVLSDPSAALRQREEVRRVYLGH